MGNSTSSTIEDSDECSATAASPTQGSVKDISDKANDCNTMPPPLKEQEASPPLKNKQKNKQPKNDTNNTTTEVAVPKSNIAKAPTSGPFIQITNALSDVRVKYHVNSKELGHGHYGVVRKCQNRETKLWYAIKSIRKSKVKKIEVLKNEVEILREVKHPNIIELVDIFEDTKYLHIVTELCTGGELFDRIVAKSNSPDGHYSEHDAANIIRDTLDAIAYCHSKGIVHRDLKPENFLFLNESEESPVKIIDFGLSRHMDADNPIMRTKVGTPYYVAPEVLRREYNEECDIWSIGVITYILLCGYPPFYGDNDTEIFQCVRIGKFDFPSPEWDDISDTAKDFVCFLLQSNAHLRPTALEAMEHSWITTNADPKEKDNTNKIVMLTQSARGNVYQKYLGMQKLKKATLVTIAKNLTHEQVGKLEDIFQRVEDTKNRISLMDFHDSIIQEQLSEQLQTELEAMKEELHLTDSETLDWRAFLAATVDKTFVMREDKIRYAFDHFVHSEDKDYLTMADFDNIFEGDIQQGREVFRYLDTNGDGHVMYEDFRRAMSESIDLENNNDEKKNDNDGNNNGTAFIV